MLGLSNLGPPQACNFNCALHTNNLDACDMYTINPHSKRAQLLGSSLI